MASSEYLTTESSLPELELTTDSPPPKRKRTPRPRKKSDADGPQEFQIFKDAYPPRAGGQGWANALRQCNQRLSEGTSWNQMISGAKRYAAYVEATHRTGTEYVKQAATFVGPDQHFLDDWALPPAPKDRRQIRQDENVSAALSWLSKGPVDER